MSEETVRAPWTLSPDRLFDGATRELARRLYAFAKDLQLVCPEGHVSPAKGACRTEDA